MPALKAVPPGLDTDRFRELLAAGATLDQLPTPLVTVSESALAHNLETMARWCRDTGVDLAPHGKTTMNLELWRRQLDAGAWGITVATPWQATVALDAGIERVMLANALIQPGALAALAPEVARLTVWSDSLRGVQIMHDALTSAGAADPLGVVVEVGGAGGRTGVRALADGLEIARAVAASPVLRLAGVGGYEGALAHTSDTDAIARVREYLGRIGELHDAIEAEGLYPGGGEAILTAGGSAFFDDVAAVLGERHDPTAEHGRATRVILRSGAYIVHDDGFYRGISPLSRGAGPTRLRSAMHGWASIVSRPEPGLVLVDAGKRDFSFDEGLPEPQLVRRLGSATTEPLSDARCTAMNDQHAFVEIPADSTLEIGDAIRFGLSHPCTVFDKWRALVVIDDDRAAAPRAIGLLETEFG